MITNTIDRAARDPDRAARDVVLGMNHGEVRTVVDYVLESPHRSYFLFAAGGFLVVVPKTRDLGFGAASLVRN